jgi:hypothetical protein
MTALMFYAIFAGLLGWSTHKKWWGVAAFALAMVAWMIVIQVCTAISLHPTLN